MAIKKTYLMFQKERGYGLDTIKKEMESDTISYCTNCPDCDCEFDGEEPIPAILSEYIQWMEEKIEGYEAHNRD